jgi:hypothetical protein
MIRGGRCRRGGKKRIRGGRSRRREKRRIRK